MKVCGPGGEVGEVGEVGKNISDTVKEIGGEASSVWEYIHNTSCAGHFVLYTSTVVSSCGVKNAHNDSKISQVIRHLDKTGLADTK